MTRLLALCASLLLMTTPLFAKDSAAGVFQAGAYAMTINPVKLPTHVGGAFLDRTSSTLLDDLHARCLVLDDGRERVAIVIVDSVGLPRELLDKIKDTASAKNGIRTDRILIAADHTHSAPAAMNALGTPADEEYAQLLMTRIPEGIEQAAKNLTPARIGWTVIQDWEHTHTRRWIRRPDKMDLDPFGERTVRANMHPGFQSPDVIGPSGPSDPDISILSIQSVDGRPLALLANYANHYYGSPVLLDGSPVISADYFGVFADLIGKLVTTGTFHPPFAFAVDPELKRDAPTINIAATPFVGIMSQGTSGDQMWPDYSQAEHPPGLERYSEAIALEVYAAYKSIVYKNWVPLKMAEVKLVLGTRKPDEQGLAKARQVVAGMKQRSPSTIPEVYAVDELYRRDMPPTEELKLQAIRIGDLGITAIPNEVYALTGLKIKAQSPLQPTINIELANGEEGYLPPPEQHKLGGYTTWPWRHLRLEYQAEPKIVEAVLSLLENVSNRPRRTVIDTHGAYASAVLASKPFAYWRLNELSGPTAYDATGQKHEATYEDGIAFYLPGPDSNAFSGAQINRAPHLAGGRIRAHLKLADQYSVEFWCWNGLPTQVREITGWLFSAGGHGVTLGLGGQGRNEGRLILVDGDQQQDGASPIPLKTWTHLALVRDGRSVRVYLNGNPVPDVSLTLAADEGLTASEVFFGGQGDEGNSLEGKIDEIAVYNRALSSLEVIDHFRVAGMTSDR
jgi:Concanavalin A-like lectin/glucanases superfamily